LKLKRQSDQLNMRSNNLFSITFISLVSIFFIISCNKEVYDKIHTPIPQQVRSSYESQAKEKYVEKNFLTQIKYEPDWDRVYQESDSSLFIGINVLDSLEYIRTEQNQNYALAKRMFLTARYYSGSWHFQTNLLIPVKGSRQEAFSGTVITADAFSPRIGYSEYYRGEYINKKMNSIRSGAKVAGTWITTNCRSVTASMGGYSSTTTVCDYIYIESGNGGGSGQPNGPLPEPDPRIPTDAGDGPPNLYKLTKKPSTDPCAGRASVNERANLDSAKLFLNKIVTLTDSVEYAYETFMSSIVHKELQNTPIRTDGIRDEVQWNMKWGDNGLTVGFVHSHPFESAPTPHDLFNGLSGYNQIQPVSQRAVFTEYFSSTIVTENYIYVVTIKDANKWLAMGTNFEEKIQTGIQEYKYLKDDYKNKNPTALQSEAQEFALLTLYKDVVNIYRSNKSGIWDFKPLQLDSSTNKPSSQNCNP